MEEKKINKASASVSIDGTDFTANTLKLNLKQSLNSHHQFKISLNYFNKETNVLGDNYSEIFKLIGKPIEICISENDTLAQEFHGVVQHVDVDGGENTPGTIIINGGSPTVLMTEDYQMNSFTEMNLGDIAQEIVNDLGVEIKTNFEPDFMGEFPFAYQYRESSYNFLRRLASACGESLYYDGKQLVMGFPKDEGVAINLSIKHDLTSVKFGAKLTNFGVEQYDYNYATDTVEQQISHYADKRTDKFCQKTVAQAEEVYGYFKAIPSDVPSIINSGGSGQVLMLRAALGKHFTRLASGTCLRAKSTTAQLKLNGVFNLVIDPEQSSTENKLDSYRIISIEHKFNGNGYSNKIEAICSRIDFIPTTPHHQPIAMPEVATVIDNADPENLGRVKVKFQWQTLKDHPQHKTSGWMRVQTHSAGSSEAVGTDRGLFFIPEIDDQVLVSFEYGDPSRPYVSGSLFYSQNTAGAVGENDIKSITTRSGHTIRFDDTADAEKISIYDKEGSIIEFDTVEKSLTINSAENINLKAKNITIRAEENINIGADKDMQLSAEGDLSEIAKGNVAIQSDGDTSVKSKGMSIEASADATVKGTNAIIEGKANAELNGTQTKVTGSALAEVSGGIVKVN
ncbi:MAG: type VI secretion system Vgr family protein [Mangrovibacterium sp.]